MKGEQVTEPLLYIDQLVFQKPKAYMQNHYHYDLTETKVDEFASTDEIEGANPKDGRQDESFKNLTIQEKINYLVNLPSEVPKMKCEVITDEKKHRGTLIEERDEEIVVRIFGRENAIIHKDEILNIDLLGF